MKYNDYVIQSIIATNQFGITEVKELQSINYRSFVREEFLEIVELILNNNIQAVKSFPKSNLKKGHYLDIMLFNDQNSKSYITAIYDSDALEQDPQVIEIYPLTGASMQP